MPAGLYRFADKTVKVESLYDDVHSYCSEYAVPDGKSDFTVSTSMADIEYERGQSSEGFSPGYLEELAVYRKICEILPSYGTFLMHGSCVAIDGEGYMFIAPSGVGKSTHVKLLCDLLGTRAVVVNDDKPLISVGTSSVNVYGTPYNGKHRRGNPICVPLRAVCFLSRSGTNSICPVSASDIYPMLIRQIYRPHDRSAYEQTLSLLSSLTQQVSFYKLQCNMDISAAECSYAALRGERP